MRLTVLGVCGGYPAAGRACSGYLVESGGTALLVDCGSGVVANLARHFDFRKLQAVVFSHLHGDHMSDLLVLRYAVQRAIMDGTRSRPLAVYAPPLPEEDFAMLRYKQFLDVQATDPKDNLRWDRLSVAFLPVPHPVLTHAMALVGGGKKLVYTGDTSWHEPLIEFAAGADLLLCEATLLEDQPRAAGHLTGRQAGELARQAKVRRLLLTHLWPGTNWNRVLEEAVQAVGDSGLPVELAGEGSRYLL